MHTIARLAAVLGLCLVAQGVRADIILIDFGTVAQRHSVGVADSSGNFWDYITGVTDNNLDLINSDGVATEVDLALSGFTGGGPATYNAGLLPDSGLNGGVFAYTNVTDDAVFFTATDSPVMTLSGLNDAFTYDLTFYGSRVNASTRFTTYQVGAGSVELQTSGSTLTGSWNADTVVTLSGLTSVGGTLAISMAGNTQAGQAGTATFGYINAMQINVVPEPSTALLIMLGGLAGLYARATRRATAG